MAALCILINKLKVEHGANDADGVDESEEDEEDFGGPNQAQNAWQRKTLKN